MKYKLIRSSRKTVSVTIDEYGQVVVKTPLKVAKKIIDKIVEDNISWIDIELTKRKDIIESYYYIKTGMILYYGNYVKIKSICSNDDKNRISYDKAEGFLVESDGNEITIRSLVEGFYKTQAKAYLNNRTIYWANKIGVNYNKISIRKQKTRWGSCSSSGNLSYNLKIICAPIETIDYVVLHEVMHLRHMNHGDKFWRELEEYMPDYKVRSEYLDKFGNHFVI